MAFSVVERLRAALPEVEITLTEHWDIGAPTRVDACGYVTDPFIDRLVGFFSLVTPQESVSWQCFLAVIGPLGRNLLRALRVLYVLINGWVFAKTGRLISRSTELRGVLRTTESHELLYIAGGPALNEVYLTFLIARVVAARFFSFFGKPVVISGQGIIESHTRLFPWILKVGLRGVDTITLRDYQSEEVLKNARVKGPSILTTGDDSHGLKPADKDTTKRLISEVGLDPDCSILGVHARLGVQTGRELRTALEYSKPMVEILDHLIDRFQVSCLFVPMRFERADLGDDRDLAYHVRRHMKRWKNSAVIHEEFDAAVCKALPAFFQMFIGTGYHGIVFALAAGVPSVGLYEGSFFESRLRGLFRWYDLEDCLLEYAKATPERVEEIFRHLKADEQSFASQTTRVNTKLRRSIDIPIARAVALLGAK